MNDPPLFVRDRASGFSRLNEAERQVLRLLDEGHTAKSIANVLGSPRLAFVFYYLRKK